MLEKHNNANSKANISLDIGHQNRSFSNDQNAKVQLHPFYSTKAENGHKRLRVSYHDFDKNSIDIEKNLCFTEEIQPNMSTMKIYSGMNDDDENTSELIESNVVLKEIIKKLWEKYQSIKVIYLTL